jgi:hypothetical protein
MSVTLHTTPSWFSIALKILEPPLEYYAAGERSHQQPPQFRFRTRDKPAAPLWPARNISALRRFVFEAHMESARRFITSTPVIKADRNGDLGC